MAITPDNIRNRYPQFSALADAQIAEFIDDAELVIAEDTWLDLRDRAVKVYTAHLLQVNMQLQLRLTSGVKSIEVGEDATIFEDADEWLQSTPYGREFLALRKEAVGVIGFDVV
jgi:hypothetical protein